MKHAHWSCILLFIVCFSSFELGSRTRPIQKKVGRQVTSYKARLERIKASGGFNARSGVRGGELVRRKGTHPQELELMVLQGKALDGAQQAQLDQFHADNPGIAEQFNAAMITEGRLEVAKEIKQPQELEPLADSILIVPEVKVTIKPDNDPIIPNEKEAPVTTKALDIDWYIDELALKAAAVKSVPKAQKYNSALNEIGARATQDLENAVSQAEITKSDLQAIVDTAFNEMLSRIKADSQDKEAIFAEIARLQGK